MVPENGPVLATAKALTTHHDLTIGIREAMALLPPPLLAEVEMVGLSSTLATNAIVERIGGDVCLILIGYEQGLIESYALRDRLACDDVVFVRGGHHADGREKEPLDIETVVKVVSSRKDRVVGFAVSGYFSVRNAALTSCE